MLEEMIINKYSLLGYLSPGRELYLPLNFAEDFINDCSKNNIAIIGIEFFHINNNGITPVVPFRGMDYSDILKSYSKWKEVVLTCNEKALMILQNERIQDSTEFFNPILFEETKR